MEPLAGVVIGDLWGKKEAPIGHMGAGGWVGGSYLAWRSRLRSICRQPAVV